MNITIVGGGFGGVKAALELAKQAKNHVTLISDKPDFQYYPAMYAVATGQSGEGSWIPLKEIFARKKNVEIVIDPIVSINPDKKVVASQTKEYSYDACVLALGMVTSYFGIKGLEEYAYGIKSATEVDRLKKHLQETVIKCDSNEHYVIVGAGPTGVEFAASLGSYLARLCGHYGVENEYVNLDLVEAAPRILPKMHERTSLAVKKRLTKLGIHVLEGKAVESQSPRHLMVAGEPIESQTVVWTSGVTNHPFFKANAQHFTFSKNGRVEVNEYLQARDDVYVIGDNAATPFSGLAQTALKDAKFVARFLAHNASGTTPSAYKPVMPPVVLPVGKGWAAFEWRGLRLYGWPAALLRVAADLIGYHDILPLKKALRVWRMAEKKEPMPEA